MQFSFAGFSLMQGKIERLFLVGQHTTRNPKHLYPPEECLDVGSNHALGSHVEIVEVSFTPGIPAHSLQQPCCLPVADDDAVIIG